LHYKILQDFDEHKAAHYENRMLELKRRQTNHKTTNFSVVQVPNLRVVSFPDRLSS
jgi:hypothetical protein